MSRRTQRNRTHDQDAAAQAAKDEAAELGDESTGDGSEDETWDGGTGNVHEATSLGPDPLADIDADKACISAKTLRGGLKASGTGESKLAHIDALIEAKPDASALDAMDTLIAAGVSDVTVNKAKALAGVE